MNAKQISPINYTEEEIEAYLAAGESKIGLLPAELQGAATRKLEAARQTHTMRSASNFCQSIDRMVEKHAPKQLFTLTVNQAGVWVALYNFHAADQDFADRMIYKWVNRHTYKSSDVKAEPATGELPIHDEFFN
jgi:arylamine N-acetyltransferase